MQLIKQSTMLRLMLHREVTSDQRHLGSSNAE